MTEAELGGWGRALGPGMCRSAKAAEHTQPIFYLSPPHPHRFLLGKYYQVFRALLSVRSPPNLSNSESSLFFLASLAQRVVPDQQHQHHLELVRNANFGDLLQTY